MTSPATVLAVAAVVYDQDTHSEADLAFLDAVAKADSEWGDALNTANILWGGGSVAWHAVKRLATRTREKALADALRALETADDEENETVVLLAAE